MFGFSSLKNHSNTVKLAWHLACTALLKSRHPTDVGLAEEPNQTLDVPLVKSSLHGFGVLWVVDLLKSEIPDWYWFDWYLELFLIPATLIKASVPSEDKKSQSMMLLPLCFTLGMGLFWSFGGTGLKKKKSSVLPVYLIAQTLEEFVSLLFHEGINQCSP